MQIPVIHLGRVLHVGTMNKRNLGSSGASQEGHCLSVSLCPNAWSEIARLGGNTLHELRRDDGAFLDAHAVMDDPELLEAAVDWAVSEGLAERRTLWRAWRHDDEAESWGYMTFASEEDAFDELNMDEEYEEASEVEGPDGRPGVESFQAVVGTPALAAATGVRHQPESDGTDAVLLAWGRAVAGEAVAGGLDGVWWRETYDPDSLSAPRAGIYPERVGGWASTKLRKGSIDDDEELEAMPDPTLHDMPAAPSPR